MGLFRRAKTGNLANPLVASVSFRFTVVQKDNSDRNLGVLYQTVSQEEGKVPSLLSI